MTVELTPAQVDLIRDLVGKEKAFLDELKRMYGPKDDGLTELFGDTRTIYGDKEKKRHETEIGILAALDKGVF